MSKAIEIAQGKPFSNYFKVFVPVNMPVQIGDKITCKHPVSKVESSGECTTMITEPWLKIPDWVCYDTYGLSANDLKTALEDKFPDFQGQDDVRILQIKQDTPSQ